MSHSLINESKNNSFVDGYSLIAPAERPIAESVTHSPRMKTVLGSNPGDQAIKYVIENRL